MYDISVCDSEPIAVEGLRSLLEEDPDLRIVSADQSPADAADAVRDLHPDLLLVDRSVGLGPIRDWIASLRVDGWPTGVVVWGSSISRPETLRFLEAGAIGVVRKSASIGCVLACLKAAAAGRTWMEDDVWRTAAAAPGRRTSLTARESQVMDLVERGLRNRDIASALGISHGTVKIHLKHISEKTGIRGRYGLAVSALRGKGAAAAMETGGLMLS